MTPRNRTLTGALMMLVIVPIFAGLLACMPVPIGDPERSRIDPSMSGFWLMDDNDGEAALYLFRPYDKRTWLVIGVEIIAGGNAEFEDPDLSTAGDIIATLRAHPAGANGLIAELPAVYKAWLAKIGKRRFMTWESIGDIHDAESFSPEYWLVFAIEEQQDERYTMRMVVPAEEVFEELGEAKKEDGWDPWKARRQWERALRRNIGKPELYTEDLFDMRRLPDDLSEKAVQLVEMAIMS